MKLLATKGVIAMYGDQASARAAESTITPRQRNVHNLNKEKAKNKEPLLDRQEQPSRAKLAEETKKVPSFKGNSDKQVIISSLLDGEAEKNHIRFL